MPSDSRLTPWLIGGLMGLSVGLIVLLTLMVLRPEPDPTPEPSTAVVDPGGADLDPVPTPVTAEDPGEELQRDRANAIVRASQRVSAVVVSINTLRSEPPPRAGSELLHYLRHGPRRVVGLGSGVLVDHRGLVLTAFHVVAGSERLNVTLSTGETFAAAVAGISPEYDLALVRIQGEVSGLPVAAFGDSDRLRNGEWAIAIGSPFGHLISDSSPTVTVGVISAVHRDVRLNAQGDMMYDVLQTDAAINPGNSGGPLVNARGEVIGINTAVISDQAGQSTGLGFAIPINRARWIMEEMRDYGRVRQHTMGINGYPITDALRQSIFNRADVPDGFLVESIVRGSPGAEVGLLPRDVITHVDGRAIFDRRERERVFYDARVGQRLELTVWRDGETFEAEVTLAERTGP